jgi:transposase
MNGLSVLVAAQFQMSPFEDNIFVFCNKSRTAIKILEWDSNGFWLFHKKLDRGHFNWPSAADRRPMELTADELQMMLDGTKLIQKLKRQQIKPLNAC